MLLAGPEPACGAAPCPCDHRAVLLETQRLLLRPFTETDVEELARIYADPEVTRFMGEGRPLDRAGTWRAVAGYIGHLAMRGYGVLAVVERSTGRLLGRSGPWYPEGWPGLEVGWVIDRARWGEGFATEAGRASLDHCFDVLGAHEVISLIQPGNIASVRVAEKLGARPERQLRDFLGAPIVDVYVHRSPTAAP
jgi:RimJ/RimL family protein N-acetyltransferase